jgi:hypothetical protein
MVVSISDGIDLEDISASFDLACLSHHRIDERTATLLVQERPESLVAVGERDEAFEALRGILGDLRACLGSLGKPKLPFSAGFC